MHRMRNVQLQEDMFPSNSSLAIATKKANLEKAQAEEKWKSYYEFIAFCIGKHSTLVIYVHFKRLNFVQDFLIYLLVGIPVCYVQLILGQYTNVGIFLIRRMLPLAQGISYVYFLTIFTLTIIIVTEMETNLIYFILALAPSETVWNLCPPDYKDVCWDFSQKCTTEKPCMDAYKRLPTYIFWNYTYLGGAFPLHKARIAWPEGRVLWVAVISWLSIYFLTVISFKKIKKSVQVMVALSVILKVLFVFKYLQTLGFQRLALDVLSIRPETWLDQEAWKSSISRVISSMMLGDFTYIMFGVYTTYKEKTGSMSFIGALCGYGIFLIEIIIIKGAVRVLIDYSKIDDTNYHWFFVPHAPDSLIIVPASLGLLGSTSFWTTMYFTTNIITYLIWCVINIAFMQQSLYQRFTGMQSYYKYICPTFCLVGFSLGIFNQSRQVYEIRFDLTMTVDSFCQHTNLILLTLLIVFIYGFKKLGDDIQFMTGKQPSNFWKVTWVISPIIMMVTIPYEYLDREHPFFRLRIITIIAVFSPLFIFGLNFTMKRIYHRDMFSLLRSDPLWGPKDSEMRELRNEFNPRKQTKYRRYNQKCPHLCLLNHPTYKQVIAGEDKYDATIFKVDAGHEDGTEKTVKIVNIDDAIIND